MVLMFFSSDAILRWPPWSFDQSVPTMTSVSSLTFIRVVYDPNDPHKVFSPAPSFSQTGTNQFGRISTYVSFLFPGLDVLSGYLSGLRISMMVFANC